MGFDIGFGILLLLGMLRGFRRGFARQMLTLVGLVLGILFCEPAAKQLLPQAAPHLNGIPDSLHLPLLTIGILLAILLGTLLAGSMYLTWYRTRAFGVDAPSFGDRLFGAGLGLVKAAVGVCFVCYLFDHLPLGLRQVEPLRSQYASSRGVQVAEEHHVIEQILQAPEMQHLKEHCTRLFKHVRNANAGTDTKPAEPANPAPAAPAS